MIKYRARTRTTQVPVVVIGKIQVSRFVGRGSELYGQLIVVVERVVDGGFNFAWITLVARRG